MKVQFISIFVKAIFCVFCLLLTMLGERTVINAQERGWANELMPKGITRGQNKGEYIVTKTGDILIYIPAGQSKTIDFTVSGNPPAPREDIQDINLPAFYIGKYETTVGSFRKFVAESKFKTEAERLGKATILEFPKGPIEKAGANWSAPGFTQTDSHPVVLIVWDDAKAYCDWAGGHLPSRSEWIKAALWDETAKKLRTLPWGEPPVISPVFGPGTPPPPPFADAKKGNFLDLSYAKVSGMQLFGESVDDGYALTSPVGNYPEGKSYYGAYDMAGNISEWTSDQVTSGMKAMFSGMPDGYLAMGDSWSMRPGFPLKWHLVPQPIPGGRLDYGFRLVISAK